MKYTGLLATAIICLAGSSAIAAEPTTILAFGDSITEGGHGFVSYRKPLVAELERRKLSFTFIGPEKDSTSAHAGYGGKNTRSLRAMSEDIYKKFPADIVLIHSGHNSFSKDKPVPGIVADTEGIIETLRTINPEVHILLAQVIPAGKLPKYAYIPELNQELARLARRLQKNGDRVTLVNLAEGFEWQLDTIGDKVHPSPSGAKKMAEKWLEALLPHLETK
jgi:lysophospholipase L1-like esterase